MVSIPSDSAICFHQVHGLMVTTMMAISEPGIFFENRGGQCDNQDADCNDNGVPPINGIKMTEAIIHLPMKSPVFFLLQFKSEDIGNLCRKDGKSLKQYCLVKSQ